MSLSLGAREILIAVGAFVGSALGTLALVAAFLVLVPADYFVTPPSLRRRDAPLTPLRLLRAVGKNLLGVVVIVVGLVLSIPGVPGQGLLTVLVGLMLIDLPGKRGLELRSVSRRPVIRGINRLRARFGRQALLLEKPPSVPAPSTDRGQS